MRPRPWWMLVPLLLAGVAACGTAPATPPGAGQAASVNLSLNTVRAVRSVTVSPGKATFGNCRGGKASLDTPSTPGRNGNPNGTCWVGARNGPYPIYVTNTGIASDIYVSASGATPADGGTGWVLCNTGANPAVPCSGDNKPGVEQYQLRNFSQYTPLRADLGGLTGTPSCDRQFGPAGSCWAREGMWQAESFEVIGPSAPPADTSSAWTVVVTWMPVPGRAG